MLDTVDGGIDDVDITYLVTVKVNSITVECVCDKSDQRLELW